MTFPTKSFQLQLLLGNKLPRQRHICFPPNTFPSVALMALQEKKKAQKVKRKSSIRSEVQMSDSPSSRTSTGSRVESSHLGPSSTIQMHSSLSKNLEKRI